MTGDQIELVKAMEYVLYKCLKLKKGGFSFYSSKCSKHKETKIKSIFPVISFSLEYCSVFEGSYQGGGFKHLGKLATVPLWMQAV